MARDTWYRLDNIGKFYAAQAGQQSQTVFRYAARMDAPVDPAALQQALDEAIAAFPGFNVHLRTGFFWHYLEQAAEQPQAEPEQLPICAPLHAGRQSVLFRVTYFRDRISFEVSHIVSDGRGALAFFTELLCAYARIAHGEPEKDTTSGNASSLGERSEDSFTKHYEKDAARSVRTPKAFRLHGVRDKDEPVYLVYHLPLQPVLAKAKELGCGFTALVIAVVMHACAQDLRASERGQVIRIGVPVDLRQAFGSSTARNFFGLAYVEWKADDPSEPIERIAASVTRQLKDITRPEALKQRMNQMIKLEKSYGLKFFPVGVKDVALGVAERAADREVTTTVSNVGRIELPPGAARHVREMDILTSTTGLNFLVCSFKDVLSIGISSVIPSSDVPMDFVRTFSNWGIHGRVDSSNALDPDVYLGTVPKCTSNVAEEGNER